MQFTTLAKNVCPDLVTELRAAKNPEEASAAIQRHSATLDRIAAGRGRPALPWYESDRPLVGRGLWTRRAAALQT